MIDQTKFTYSPLGKVLGKQTKTIKIKEENKQINAIMNQNKRQVDLINNGPKNLSDKGIFKKCLKERFGEIVELTYETNFDDLIYYFKTGSNRKRFEDFENSIKLFEKT